MGRSGLGSGNTWYWNGSNWRGGPLLTICKIQNMQNNKLEEAGQKGSKGSGNTQGKHSKGKGKMPEGAHNVTAERFHPI